LFAPLRLAALALAGGTLSYWAFARTTTYAVPASLDAGMLGLSFASAVASALLAGAALVCWRGSQPGRQPALARWASRIEALPVWWAVLPVAMAASYVAARIVLSPNGSTANYWPAFGLWTASMALILGSFASASGMARAVRAARSLTWRQVLRSDALVILLLVAAALAVRAAKLDAAPPLVHVDEEAIASEGLLMVEGEIRNMFAVGWGASPTMGFLPFGVFSKIFGVDIVTARLVSATFGALGVAATYILLREMFGRWPALIGAIFLIGYQFHIHFSRVALNVIWDSAFLAAALYFAYRAAKEQRPFHFVAAAVLAGLGLYLYHGSRVVSVVLAAYFAYLALTQPRLVRANIGNLALAVAAFAVVVMPIGAYFLTHEWTFSARVEAVGIFQSGWFEQQQDAGRSAVSILWDQTLHAFGGYVYYSENSPFTFSFEPVPLVGGIAALPFMAGFVYSVLNLTDKRYGLLLVAFVVPTILGGALVVGPNNGQRLMSTVPAIAGFVAVGLWQLGRHLLFWRPSLVIPLATLASVGLAAIGLHAYFDAAVNRPIYGGVANTMAVRYITALPRETRIYWYGAPAISASFSPYSLHDRHLIEVFDATPQEVTPVLEPTSSVYIFTADRESALSPLEQKCPGGETKAIEFRGNKVLTAYELTTPNACIPDVGAPDDFAQARPVVGLPFLDFTTTVDAGVEFKEPLPCELGLATVWYSLVPSTSGRVAVDTAGSWFDTVLAVYTGTDLGSLELIGCNDDVDGTRSLLEFEARAGTPYYVQVGSSGEDPASLGGLVQLSVSSTSAP
jgi:4-amino-4-deoxy-L-arabinose transferase-like glycosyltransferase